MAVTTTIKKQYLILKKLRELLENEFPGEYEIKLFGDYYEVSAPRELTESWRVTLDFMAQIEEIRSELAKGQVQTADGKWYFPPAIIQHLLCESVIESAVTELDCAVDERLGLADDIKLHGIIVFALLVWLKKPNAIVKFRRHGCLDAKLPLSISDAEKVAPGYSLCLALEHQWEFIPFEFPTGMAQSHYCLNDNQILPIIGLEQVDEGAYGTVSRVLIPSALQSFPSLPTNIRTNICVIRKTHKVRKGHQPTIEPSKTFNTEMSNLRILQTLHHRNIVPLLGSYSHRGEHHFLFPPFQGNLESIFNNVALVPGKFTRKSTWFFALHGLASALEQIHELHLERRDHGVDFDAIGSHNDLRPQNILISDDTLLLADFGLGELKPMHVQSESMWKAGIGDYLAPECMDGEFNNQVVDRLIDVWAFGCLLTEAVTYLQRDSQGVMDFRSFRSEEYVPKMTTGWFHSVDGQLKQKVKIWIQSLEEQSSSTAIQRTLQIVTRALKSKKEDRPSMSQIRSDLAVPALSVLLEEVQKAFEVYQQNAIEHAKPVSMDVWYAEERLHAFQHAISPVSSISDDPPPKDQFFGKTRKTLEAILEYLSAQSHVFHPVGSSGETSSFASNFPEASSPIKSFNRTIFEQKEQHDKQLKKLVETLWDHLPQRCANRAMAAWFESMQAKDADRLEKLQKYAQSKNDEMAVAIAARAEMREALLAIQNNLGSGASQFLLDRATLRGDRMYNDHVYGQLQGHGRVLVEWMFYRPDREVVPTDQRIFNMMQRAKNFSVVPKPSGLRMLRCVGFIRDQDENGHDAYGFLYELPHPTGKTDQHLVTLKSLVMSEGNEPPLHIKFQLAHSLALFLEEFHNHCGLHENFNYRNVVFSKIPSTSDVWDQPYVVGLQKSRPDGQNWGTEGPQDSAISQRFATHPDYLENGRFIPEHDYYSFGLTLIEIGCWKSMESYFEHFKKMRGDQELDQLRSFRQHLIAKYVPRLSIYVGKVYSNVVRKCLESSWEKTEEDEKTATTHFIREVTMPMERLSNLII